MEKVNKIVINKAVLSNSDQALTNKNETKKQIADQMLSSRDHLNC